MRLNGAWCRRSGGGAAMLAALLLLGCAQVPVGPDDVDEPEQERPIDPVVRRFSFTSLDGQVISSSSMRGRMTVIMLFASYDDASQAQARFVKEVMIRHVPRINALGLVLDLPVNRPLTEMFAESFGLPYPMAMGDDADIAGKGAFPGLNRVPSVLLLDRDGREVWRHVGLIDATSLSAAIAKYDSRAR